MVLAADSLSDSDTAKRIPRVDGLFGRLRNKTLEPLWNAMERVLTRGDLSTRCAAMHEELSPLREMFDAMVERLERRERAREGYRRELAAALAAREAELQQLRRRSNEVLSALDQGVIVIDGAGIPRGVRSAAFDRFFGAPEPGQTFAQVIARASARFASELADGWLQLEDGIVPRPLVLSSLPRTLLDQDGRSFRFAYHALDDATLVVISEITDSVELHALEQAQQQER